LRYGIGRPFHVGRVPVLSVTFALIMSLFGSASYWATVQLYPAYRVDIERAGLMVAVCTALSMMSATAVLRLPQVNRGDAREELTWDWPRLAALTYLLFAIAAVGTLVAIRRIGYVPVLSGDPESLRV